MNAVNLVLSDKLEKNCTITVFKISIVNSTFFFTLKMNISCVSGNLMKIILPTSNLNFEC